MNNKLVISISTILVLTALSFMAACAPVAPAPTPATTPAPAPKAEPIKLKAVQFLPVGNAGAVPFKQLVDKINETAKGQLQIEIVGGPETIPPTDQPESVRKGAVDIVFSMYANFRPIVPLAGFINMIRISQKDQLPGTLWYDFAVENFGKSGLRYLWEGAYVTPFHMYSTKPVNNPSELKGLRMRSTAAYPFLKDIGTTPVTLEHGEIYTAVQTSLIDGMVGKNTTFVEQSLWEVMKYVIGPPFWGTANMGVVINQSSWDKLPKQLQDLVIDSIFKIHAVKEKENQAYLDNDWNKMKEKGVKYIQWSDADNKWFLDTIDGVMFKRAETALTPEVLAKFKKLGGF